MKKRLGEEVFIAAQSDEDIEGEIMVLSSVEELVRTLKNLDLPTNPDARVIHGILSSIKFLPEDFRGKAVFIMCLEDEVSDDSISYRGVIGEMGCSNSQELAEKIDDLINSADTGISFPITVENIYIVYGYEVPVCLTINEEDLDEERIYTCEKVHADAVEVQQIFEAGG